ncbi:gag-protease polyprotein [Trifolium repens]|nr:gag-protease polyprotein [Trifolium repens]
MDMEGASAGRPPLLEGTNYDYWKSRMMAFLKSMDSQTWKTVIKGWEHPVMRGTTNLKPEENWSKKEDELALANNKALNALFSGVDKYMFRLIKKCTVAKDAWEILKTTHEGTPKVKMSRLQLLTTKFENLRMKEDESVHDFHMNVIDFSNSFDSLGEKIPEEKLVRKILRSLPRKFDMKVTAIEEAQDISSMKVDELIGSLQTFELYINERSEMKNNISKNGNVQRKGEPDDETVEHIAAFTGRYESDEDSCDEDITFDEFASTYKELLTRYEEMCRILEKQKKTINKLQAEVNIQVEKATQAEEKVIQVNVQMDDLRKHVSQLNSGTNLLEQILESVPSGKAKSVGYNYTSLNQYQHNPETKFMPAEGVFDPCTRNVMLKHHTQHPRTYPVPKFESDSKPHVHQRTKSQRRYRRWVCHHCGKKGHIRPFYFKLYGYPERNQQAKHAPEVINVKKEWKPKDGSSTLITKATPITTVPVITAKKNKTSIVKKGTFMPVSESPSSSTYVPFGTETRPLVKPKSDETLGQPSLNVAIECANMSPTKVVDSVIGSLKETLHESNVVPDVSASVALPWLTSDMLCLGGADLCSAGGDVGYDVPTSYAYVQGDTIFFGSAFAALLQHKDKNLTSLDLPLLRHKDKNLTLKNSKIRPSYLKMVANASEFPFRRLQDY